MKHIKLIEDEQLLEQISGGRAAPVVKQIKAEVNKFVLAVKSLFARKTPTTKLE